MSEYAPSKDDVRWDYQALALEKAGKPYSESGPEYDRMIVDIEREAAARALEEAAAALNRPSEGVAYEVWAYGGGDWLRARAAEIREGNSEGQE